jgi:hypothetical protein
MADLNHAVEAANGAVKATPSDHPNRAASLNNLGIRLGRHLNGLELLTRPNWNFSKSTKAVSSMISIFPAPRVPTSWSPTTTAHLESDLDEIIQRELNKDWPDSASKFTVIKLARPTEAIDEMPQLEYFCFYDLVGLFLSLVWTPRETSTKENFYLPWTG